MGRKRSDGLGSRLATASNATVHTLPQASIEGLCTQSCLHRIAKHRKRIVTKKRTLQEALQYGKNYAAQLKHSSDLSDSAKTKLRRHCKFYISAPYAKKIDFKNILIPEFHTWLNKAKRLDNRLYELAKKIDAVLKCNLAVTKSNDFDMQEFNLLTKQIFDESQTEHSNIEKIKSLKKKLASVSGPIELTYEMALKKHRIVRSTAHGGGFTGRNAWQLFQSPEICKFLTPQTWHLQDGDSFNLGSDYAYFRFQEYMMNTVKELKLSSYPGTLCEHEKKNLEILIAENGRERHILFPNHIPLRSDHYRAHLPNQIQLMGDLIPSERGTERKNQHLLQIQRNITSRIYDNKIKAHNEFFRAAL